MTEIDDQDGPTFEQKRARRIQQEIREFETDTRSKQQAALDRWIQSQRNLQAEAEDIYMVGGFLERHSMNVSFHKSKRDRDWRGRAMRDDPEVTCGCLPIFLTDEDKYKLVDEDIQLEVFLEITGKLIEYVEAALQERGDPWKPIRIFAQAERLLGEYVEYNFHRLMPLQRELRDTVHTACRMARRFFIKAP
jgi:hypothetical protein